ncbi:muscle, skeletal receptor tyrosine-protein kinase-like isoform X2 [Montipora capricornis]|uniref:muscle, skeletal receptor tyrosine-protein kinase-like isoform X2 n=1 Tax=Montipora capricornis TaxID=246305 RepID=UPI0035F1DA7F
MYHSTFEKIMQHCGELVFLALLMCPLVTKAIQPNCSAISDKEKVGCVINTNATLCHLMGCCWNPEETNQTLRCYTKGGGTCMPYQGKVCRQSLNTTLSDYRVTPRFIDNKFGLLGTEQFLSTVTEVINDFVTDDEKCRYIMLNMLCQYTLQPCYPDNTVVEYCKEDCVAIFEECAQPLNQVIGAVKLLVQKEGIDFTHTALPDCSRHRPIDDFRGEPDKHCIQTGFFDYKEITTPPPPDTSELNLAVIIPVVIIGTLAIVVIIIVLILLGRRRKERDAVDNGFAIVKKGSMTMRDRLRAESLKSLDSRLLRLYDPNKLKQYRLDHVSYVKDLGEGFFGKVFQGRATGLLENQPKKEVAVAVKALKDEPSNEQKEEFFREVTLMSILSHPNIVKLLAVSTEEEPYGMVFEFMSQGDLNQYLRNALPAETSLTSDQKAKVYLSQEDLVSISIQIAAGMEYLSEMKFVHRDLAARNCLVGDDLVVKIGDFGMSRDIYASQYYKMSKETLLPIRWLSPEAYLYGKFSIKSDVYAYGVVLWEIFTFGLQPYYGYTNKEVMEFIQKGIHLGKPDNCPDFVYTIMKDCWTREPEKRIGFKTVSRRLKDPFHTYDEPPSSDNEEEPKQPEMTNYDIPKSAASSNYDIPRSSASEGTYDVPKSYEDLTENNDQYDDIQDVPRDVPV